MIKIDKDFQIPAIALYSPKYPWSQMEVGDSFFAPNIKLSALANARVKAQKKTGFKFVSRTVDGGVRIWRVK